MECRLAGETEVRGENLPQRNFYPSQNPTWPDPVLKPGRRGGKPATNRLSYGAARVRHLLCWVRDVQNQFPKRCVLLYFVEYQAMDKVKISSNPVGTYESANYVYRITNKEPSTRNQGML
jgi:hypothetical protein